MPRRRDTPEEFEENGKLYRIYGKKTKAKIEICRLHLKILAMCPDPRCGGGNALCVHGNQKSLCKEPNCLGGGRGLCKRHKIRKTLCKDPRCGGGGSYCEHGIQRKTCKNKDCNPDGGMYCEHGIQRTVCRNPRCGGGGSICEHDKERRNCMVCSPQTALARRANSRISAAMKSYMSTKVNRTVEYLGCDTEFFKMWIEMQMEPWMTWKNYGTKWHIDHKIPICYEKDQCSHEELLQRLRYSNCQPLCAKENMVKRAKYCH